MRDGIELPDGRTGGSGQVLTPRALGLLVDLHRRFDAQRLQLLAARERRQSELDAGAMPDFLHATAAVRAGSWRVAEVPEDLRERRVEIAGPPDRRTIANALSAPVGAFMADFEDSCSPTWENLLEGQASLADAIQGRAGPGAGRQESGAARATLIVRPRGWHFDEKHVRIDGQPVAGALFDFALYVGNNFEALARQGSGPYLCLAKLESHLEARLWNEVFLAAQEALGMPSGTIRAAVRIETVPAAFEMDEILHELREHAIGLDFGRWNYAFSFIKRFRSRPDFLLPDRQTLALDSGALGPQLDLLGRTCERRGAQAMTLATGRSAARAPSSESRASAADLIRVPDGQITEAGLRGCIRVGVLYLEAWLRGVGRVPLHHRFEDAATADVCRAQLWQCLRHEARTSDGRPVTTARLEQLMVEELDRIHDEVGPRRLTAGVFPTATRLLEQMIEQEPFEEFLSGPAYELLS